MSFKNTSSENVIGVDAGKQTLVIHEPQTHQTRHIDNEPTAIGTWLTTLPKTALIVCEASGGYEARLLAKCIQAGQPVHRADAVKVKRFIASLRHHGKTDPLDAKALAQYGRERHASLTLWKARDEKHEALQQLMHRREDLIAQRTAEKTRLQAPNIDPFIRSSCQAVIKALNAQITRIDERIQDMMDTHTEMKDRYTLMTAQPGIGPVTALKLMAFMPELGTLTRRQIASLAGVAPHPNDSGKRSGYRAVRGGRPHVRRALFMAAMAASRTQGSDLRAKYLQLIQNGKKPMVALTAIMRKIIVRINAKIRDNNKILKQS